MERLLMSGIQGVLWMFAVCCVLFCAVRGCWGASLEGIHGSPLARNQARDQFLVQRQPQLQGQPGGAHWVPLG